MSRTAALGELLGKAADGVRQGGQKSLEGVRQSVAELGDRLKTSPASQQVGAAVESWRLIKKAADARRRGNPGLAYRLLEPLVQSNPTEPRLVEAFWQAALASERAEDAVPCMTSTIRQLVASGKVDRAAELWSELHVGVPSARVDPSALVRIAESLERDGAEETLVIVLREAIEVDPQNLSPGLAVRIAEMAASVDPPTALWAVRRALETPDLHQAKRTRLEELEEQLAGTTSAQEQDTTRPGRTPDAIENTVSLLLDQVETPARFTGVKLWEAMPTELLEDAVGLLVSAGRAARVEYSKIEAIAVAEVMGLAAYPVVVVDLLLNWKSEQDASLRIVRLRSDGFDPRMLIEAPDDRGEAFWCFLKQLQSHCGALSLPTSAQADSSLQRFDSLEAYMRDVLHVEQAPVSVG